MNLRGEFCTIALLDNSYLYQTDFYSWALRQAQLLRNEDYADLDVANLIEEIEDMGKRDRRELARILEHLLRLTSEPHSQAPRKWRQSVLNQRQELMRLFADNHALRAQVAEFIEDAYRDGRELAATGLDCSVADLPPHCPWSVAQILDVKWWP